MTAGAQEQSPPQTATNTRLLHLIERLADNKYWLGRRYAEWCTSAPTLESAVAAAAMAQDEIGHARSHYPLIRHFTGVDVEPEDRKVFRSVAYLDRPFENWSDFIAANFLIDTALTTLYTSATESSYDDLRNRARRILGEEQVHWLHGKGWVRRLAGENEAVRAQLVESLRRAWPDAMTWFGPSDDQEMSSLRAQQVINLTPDVLRHAFLNRVLPVLEEAALADDMPPARTADTLPWHRWNAERFRLEDGT